MGEIKSKHVQMRPRMHFTLAATALGVGVAAAFITASIFVLRVTTLIGIVEPLSFLRFGQPGVMPFLLSLPWLSLVVAILGISVGLWLVKRFDFSYRRNFLVLATAIVAIVAIVGIILGAGALRAELHDNEQFRPFFAEPDLHHRGAVVGRIVKVGDSSITVRTPRREEVTIVWNDDTRFPHGSDFSVGQPVHSVGTRENSTFTAKIIGAGPPPRRMAPPQRQPRF